MKMAHWVVSAVVALALIVSVGTAQAASATVTADLKSAMGEISNVEKAHHRHTGYRGHRHRRHYVYSYPRYTPYYRPYFGYGFYHGPYYYYSHYGPGLYLGSGFHGFYRHGHHLDHH